MKLKIMTQVLRELFVYTTQIPYIDRQELSQTLYTMNWCVQNKNKLRIWEIYVEFQTSVYCIHMTLKINNYWINWNLKLGQVLILKIILIEI